jgi:hypothetical protein
MVGGVCNGCLGLGAGDSGLVTRRRSRYSEGKEYYFICESCISWFCLCFWPGPHLLSAAGGTAAEEDVVAVVDMRSPVVAEVLAEAAGSLDAALQVVVADFMAVEGSGTVATGMAASDTGSGSALAWVIGRGITIPIGTVIQPTMDIPLIRTRMDTRTPRPMGTIMTIRVRRNTVRTRRRVIHKTDPRRTPGTGSGIILGRSRVPEKLSENVVFKLLA